MALNLRPTRRELAVGGAVMATASALPLRSTRAVGTDERFVLVVLRGGMDGLGVVVPYGDPALRPLRPNLIGDQPGTPNGLLDLGGFWGLNPALPTVHALYRAGHAAIFHCIGGPDRSRSHFHAQDLLETGADTRLTDGWLNRLASMLPAPPACDIALSIGPTVPLVLHGSAPTTAWSDFGHRPRVSDGFHDNIVAMHANEPTGEVLAAGLRDRRYIDATMRGVSWDGIGHGFPRAARAAARLLVAPDGPRLAELDVGGWDTHTHQPVGLREALKQLDAGIAVLRVDLAPIWHKTTIMIVTEFGRTVRQNGSGGTDHGTATAAFLLGGAVDGGKVRADWPGVGERQLFEGRDLQPTMDLRSIAKSAIAAGFGIDRTGLGTIFPDSERIAPLAGIRRS